jgi:RNA polymerase sigma-70 factor (ECF subfamily)
VAENDGVLTSSTLLAALADPNHRDEAWRTFLDRYRPQIDGWCRRCGLNAADADDVAGAVLAKLVQVMRTFVYDRGQRFRAWLRTVVEHEACDVWRRRARHRVELACGDPRIQHELEQVGMPGAVDELVRELDTTLDRDLRRAREVADQVRSRVEDKTWQAFWRTAIEKDRPSDVAAQLGLSVAAVYMAKFRVGKMLREKGARMLHSATGPGGAS